MAHAFLRSLVTLCLLAASSHLGHAQDVAPPRIEPERADVKGPEVKNLKLFAWVRAGKKSEYREADGFQEKQPLHLAPSEIFDVTCDVIGGSAQLAGDLFVWTTVDFLVAPVTRAHEQMDKDKLAASVGWGQVTEMQDLRSTPIYFLRPGETRHIVVKRFDLRPVLEAFPVGDAGELWPWLIRVVVHVQDRDGIQVATAQGMWRLSPHAARKAGHYNDPLPSR